MSTIVVVTGANSGIGYAAVKSLLLSAKDKYEVLACARNQAKADDAVRRVKLECPDSQSTVVPFVVELQSDSSIEHLCDAIKTRYGKIDVLVNNAGALLCCEFECVAG
jgi:NAD(P)-dependent dehydrogenase (short-subunit alcohol dehydrogenase family)